VCREIESRDADPLEQASRFRSRRAHRVTSFHATASLQTIPFSRSVSSLSPTIELRI